MVEAIVKSNDTRKKHISDMIMLRNPNVVGIYRLNMKMASDNFRASAIQGVIEKLKEEDVQIVIYEPTMKADEYADCKVIHDFEKFAEASDVIIANRLEECLKPFSKKVYTRDLFSRDS